MGKKPMTRPILPLLISNWVLGIGIIEYPIGTPRPTFSFIYSTTLLVIYCTTSIMIRHEIFRVSIILKNNTVPMTIVFYTNIFLTISIVTLGWYRSKGLRRYVAKAAVADDLMERIGIPNNHGKMLRAVAGQVIKGFFLVTVLIAIIAVIVLVEDAPLQTKILISSVMSFPLFTMFVSDAMFTSCVRCACYRFTELNKVLKAVLTSTHAFPQHKRVCSSVFESGGQDSNFVINNVSQRKNPAVIVKLAKEIHLQLISACQEINNTYGLHLLLSIIFAFAVITGNMYLCYMSSRNSNIPHYILVKTLVVSGIWIVHYGMKICYFSIVCGCCTENSIKTGDYINEFYDEPSTTNETKLKIRQFNMQLIQKPCKFTAWGFVDLNCHLIQVMIGTITTYLMILIQLGTTTYVADDSYSKYLKSFSSLTY
ncbi:gustatory receptor 58 [Nasonia vitripennis]|uniref:Gustatory receptor n=1 Tax=Nasonia vitripennis TaxID=7425 RepID=A0A7M6W8F3_NASVI|nr:gustatory receptor 58 [Nasonia vitripennis]